MRTLIPAPEGHRRLTDLPSIDSLRHGLALRIRSDFVAAEPWCPSERQAHCCLSVKFACSPVDCKQREFSGRSDGHRKAKGARRAGNGSRHPQCQPMPCRTQTASPVGARTDTERRREPEGPGAGADIRYANPCPVEPKPRVQRALGRITEGEGSQKARAREPRSAVPTHAL